MHPQHLQQLGIKQRVYFAEINLHDLYPLVQKHRDTFRVAPVPAFPGSTRDWTVTLSEKLSIGAIFSCVHALTSPVLAGVSLIDLYKSEKIGKDKKNATFRFIYRDRNKTLEFQEVETEHQRLIESVQRELRGSI